MRTAEPRLIFINRFYQPDEQATAQMLTDLATSLASKGHRVTVVSSNPRGGASGISLEDAVEVRRVPMSRFGASSLVGRALDFGAFFRGARAQLLEAARPGDLIIPMTDPPLLGALADKTARRVGARCVHWVQDIFPEVAIALSSNPASRQLAGATRRARDLAWQHAAMLVAPGNDMAAYIADTGVPREKIAVIPNWAPAGIGESADPARLRDEWGVAGKFVVAYSGNLGRVHEIAPLAALAGLLRDERGIVFLIIGGGAGLRPLQEAAHRAGLGNMRFLPAQPRSRLAESLAAGDLHCITLKRSCACFVFPSKLYGIAATGRPILFIGPVDSEPARLVRERGMGLAFEPEQLQEAAAAIRALARDSRARTARGDAARNFAREEGGLDGAVRRWSRLLAALGHPA